MIATAYADWEAASFAAKVGWALGRSKVDLELDDEQGYWSMDASCCVLHIMVHDANNPEE